MCIQLLVAAAYFYFHWRYFTLTARVLRLQRMPKAPVLGTFFLNYALFYVCSVLTWNLLVNWALFFVFLLGETLPYGRKDGRMALFFSLNGILHGLTIHIICRCAVALVTAQPLAAFDNSAHSLKALPVFLGFLLGGMVLHLLSCPPSIEKLRSLIDHPEHLSFQLGLTAGMFLYLFLNLLLYESPDNGILLKLWGIKSCVFSQAGYYLGLRYSLKICRLSDYREKNRVIRGELSQKEHEEQELRLLAYRDPLTGAYNRPYAMEYLTSLLERQADFSLCFLDVDDLKGVNDRFGHDAGDRYLITVAGVLASVCQQEHDLLARYGGDEFLLLFPDADPETVEARMEAVSRQLQAMEQKEAIPMSVSYGVVRGGDADAAELLAAADAKMYRRKRTPKNGA